MSMLDILSREGAEDGSQNTLSKTDSGEAAYHSEMCQMLDTWPWL